MSTLTCSAPDHVIESCLKQWREKILNNYKRKDLTAADLASLFQQQVIYFTPILFLILNDFNLDEKINRIFKELFLK